MKLFCLPRLITDPLRCRQIGAFAVAAALVIIASPLRADLPGGEKRPWTSADGKSTFEGVLLESSDTEVKIKRSTDFQVFTLPLDKLSDADQAFVRGLSRERVQSAGLKDGPYAERITGQFEKGVSAEGLNYQLYGNPKWDGEKRWPLLIWLHGAGQSGADNEAQMGGATKAFSTPENQEARPCFILAPQCPSRDIGWKNEVADHLVALVRDLADRLPIDETRIYLTGSSMGGSGSWTLAAAHPELFAAVVPLCGGGDPGKAESLMGTPIWVFHGDQDDQVPVDRSRTIVKAIQDAGGALIQYSELAGEGHLIAAGVYARPELHEWIFAQQRKPPGAP